MDGSDYINANFISGQMPNSPRHYISCQAPLASTSADFWRMIYEQKCILVVMLTRLYEKNLEKATVYWPEEEGETNYYGTIAITLKSVSRIQDITIRILRMDVESPAGTISREICHLHYTEWPDFGVPRSTKLLRQLIELVDFYADRGKGPIVAHCSAGIGRTGTFIGLSICLEKLKYGQPANVMETVRQMRKQMRGMVQTKEQYMFIYAALADALREQFPHSRGLLQSTAFSSKSRPKRYETSSHSPLTASNIDVNNETVSVNQPGSMPQISLLAERPPSVCSPPSSQENFTCSFATQVSL